MLAFRRSRISSNSLDIASEHRLDLAIHYDACILRRLRNKLGLVVEFNEVTPTLENYWRSIILFGRNVASYKFALAKSLLEIGGRDNGLVRLDELAVPFSRNLIEHLRHSDKQIITRSSKFLDACRAHDSGQISESELIDTTVKLGFNNVIDAFHNVNNEDIPQRFFEDERRESGGIRLTDNFYRLVDSHPAVDLPQEVEARWRLVETAWALNLSRNLVAVNYDENENGILYVSSSMRRTNVTSCRDALNGYQKGKCFYCFDDISIVSGNKRLAEVDHFFPHVLKRHGVASPIDGVWNLVLACADCNAGVGGKSAKVPAIPLLQRLSKRNEYLIGSHHPLRQTLILQTGKAPRQRNAFLNQSYSDAKRLLIHDWCPVAKADATF